MTGGAGYIGSHAVQALVDSGQDVIIYDNLSAGHKEAARRAGGGKAVLVEGDILDTDHLRRTIEGHRADAVMHFAAWLSVAESVRAPASYYRNNVGGALSVLDRYGSPTSYTVVILTLGGMHVFYDGFIWKRPAADRRGMFSVARPSLRPSCAEHVTTPTSACGDAPSPHRFVRSTSHQRSPHSLTRDPTPGSQP